MKDFTLKLAWCVILGTKVYRPTLSDNNKAIYNNNDGDDYKLWLWIWDDNDYEDYYYLLLSIIIMIMLEFGAYEM